MGIELVKAMAHPSCASLSAAGHKVLLRMALVALDKGKDGRPAGLYFAGWAPLQIALGYEPGGPKTAGHTAVKRATRELREAGHISQMTQAARGTRQSYLVHPGGKDWSSRKHDDLDDACGKPEERGSDSDPHSGMEWGSLGDPKRGSLGDPKRGSDSDPNGGHQATLLGRKRIKGGLNEDEQLSRAASTTDCAGEPVENLEDEKGVDAHPHQGGIDDDCQTCGRSRLHIVHAGQRFRVVA